MGRKIKKHTQKKAVKQIGWQRYLLASLVGLVILLVGFVWQAPNLSMYWQNSQPVQVKSEASAVFFYKPSCAHCQKVYPDIFWYNLSNINQPRKQIQTINVEYPANQHFIQDYDLETTPVMIKDNQRVQSDNGKDFVKAMVGGQNNGEKS
ncbi:Thiol-disulfide isomerase or thioredoxin (TrxA) [Fructobacillus tropaeoli]|uniref:thioredoxin domain-containing protein n=1 Tax=Fructobacillus tropaeoli TaxID=709323 RepID=UPI002D903DDB|nr:Thiol-disulfide isomerase or thioredoxin (TrxA) [Fructobacillus tropaeoli]